jgi:hypothetical protein
MRQGVTADQMMKPLGQVSNGENYPLFDSPDCGVIAKVFAPTFTSASTTLGYLWAPIESRPRQQLHPPALDARGHAETVEFDLVQPLRS